MAADDAKYIADKLLLWLVLVPLIGVLVWVLCR